MIISQFFLNMSILVSLSVVSAFIFETFSGKKILHECLQGLLFGLAAILTMMHPVVVEPGVIFDTRTVILSLGGWFFGPAGAVLSASMAFGYRFFLGGTGMLTGLIAIILFAMAGLLLYYIRPIQRKLPDGPFLLLVGGGLHFLLIILFTITLPFHFALKVAPYFLIIHPLATLLAGKVLVNQYELRNALQNLSEKNEHIQLITASMQEVFWIMEFPSMRFSYISPSNIRHTGYTPEEAMALDLEDILAPESFQDVQKWVKNDLHIFSDPEASDSQKTRLVRERCKDGSMIWSEISISVLTGTDGNPNRIIGISRNVTRRFEQERALQSSLEEKSALLKEVHHRVKNNLQIITSLLRLESARIATPEAREVILDMQRRVRSMSLLHEAVYQSDSLARVNMKSYLENLTHQILNTTSGKHHPPLPGMEIEPVEFGIEQAIPCGLLFNELLSNACKHAFDADQPGEIHISLHSRTDGNIVLEVRDNGKGLPSDFQQKRKHSLGLQLVDDFTRQLNGHLNIRNNGGAAFRITFPLSHS
jgi:PAS domain S-box-containing protein